MSNAKKNNVIVVINLRIDAAEFLLNQMAELYQSLLDEIDKHTMLGAPEDTVRDLVRVGEIKGETYAALSSLKGAYDDILF